MKHRHIVKIAAAGASIALIATGCGSSSKNASSSTTIGSSSNTTAGATGAATSSYPPVGAGPITICYSSPQSGAFAAYGETLPKTVPIAVNIVNTQFGGIDGHKVQADVQNDQSSATQAVAIANQFVSMHKSNPNNCASIGTISQDSETAPLQAAIFNKAHMIVTASQSPDEYYEPSQFPYFFSVSAPDKALGQVAANFLEKKGLVKAAVLTDDIPQEAEYLNDMMSADKSFGGKLTFIKTASITPGSVQVQTQLAELRASNPQVLIVATQFGFGPIWQALHAMGWSPPIMGDVGFFYDGFNSLGSLASQAWAPCWQGDTPTQVPPANVIAAVNQIGPISAGSVPDPLIGTAIGLEQILLLKYAVEKAHTLNSDALKNALNTMNNTQVWFPGNDFTFNSSYHAGLTGAYGAGICNAGPLGKIGNGLNIFQYADSFRGTL